MLTSLLKYLKTRGNTAGGKLLYVPKKKRKKRDHSETLRLSVIGKERLTGSRLQWPILFTRLLFPSNWENLQRIKVPTPSSSVPILRKDCRCPLTRPLPHWKRRKSTQSIKISPPPSPTHHLNRSVLAHVLGSLLAAWTQSWLIWCGNTFLACAIPSGRSSPAPRTSEATYKRTRRQGGVCVVIDSQEVNTWEDCCPAKVSLRQCSKSCSSWDFPLFSASPSRSICKPLEWR